MTKTESMLTALLAIATFAIIFLGYIIECKIDIIETQNETIKYLSSNLDDSKKETDKYFMLWINLCRDVINSK